MTYAKTQQLEKRPAAITFAVMALPFLVSSVYLGICLDPFTPIKTLVLKLTVCGSLLAWLNLCIQNRSIAIVRTPADTPIILLATWFALSGFWALNLPLWMNYLTLYACGAGLFYVIVFYFRKITSVYRLCAFMLLPVFFVMPLGVADIMNKSVFVWDYLFVNRFYTVFDLVGIKGSLPPAWTHNFSGRISSTFGNPVYLAGWTVMLLPLSISMLMESRTTAMRIYTALSTILISFMMAASFTRSSWISCAVSMMIFLGFILKNPGGVNRKSLLFTLVIIAVSIAAPLAFFSYQRTELNPTPFSIPERIESIANSNDPSMLERELIWKTAVDMAVEQPLKGFGLGNFEVHQPFFLIKYFKQPEWKKSISFPDRVHNEYLDLWVETGIIGLLLFIFLLFSLAKAGMKGIERGGTIGALSTGLLSGGIGLLIYSGAQFPLHVTATGTYAWIFAALLVILGYGDSLSEKCFAMPTQAGSFTKILSNSALSLVFASLAINLFAPVMGQAAFQWGVYETDPEKTLESMTLMKYGIATNPGNLEMSVRYCMMANKASERVKNPDTKNLILMKSDEEALSGLGYHPNESRLYISSGIANIKLNNPEKAIKMLEKAVVLNPIEPVSFYNLGIAQYMYAMYNYSTNNKYNVEEMLFRALLHYRNAMELAPKLPGLQKNVAQVLMQLGRYQEAIGFFLEDLKINGESKEIYNYLGRAYAGTDDSNHSIAAYRKALELDPEYDVARGNLAIELIDCGFAEEATEELEKILQKDPENGIARYQLGKALHISGNDEQALKELERAAELMTDSTSAIELIQSISGGYNSK